MCPGAHCRTGTTNPTDPTDLTDDQKADAVTMTFAQPVHNFTVAWGSAFSGRDAMTPAGWGAAVRQDLCAPPACSGGDGV